MAKPLISRVSPANPGESAQIFGENLTGCRVYVWYPDESIEPEDAFTPKPYPPRPADAIEMEVTAVDDRVIVATVPYIAYGCYLIWVENGEGSVCHTLNRPEVWNQSLRYALPDERFSLYGQCYFGFDQRYFNDTTCVMKNRKTGEILRMHFGVTQDMQQNMPGQFDHRSDYRLPADLPAGDYLYAMTNGTGGAWGWSEPRELTVLEKGSLTRHCRMRWNAECRQNTVYDMSNTVIERIPASYGDGFTDVTELLQETIRRVAAVGGGFVLLPAGRFGITKTLEILPGVVLKGAGMGATTLTVTEGGTLAPVGLPPLAYASRASDGKNWSRDWKFFFDRTNNTPLTWIRTDAGIEDMTLEGGSGAVMLTVVGQEDETPSEGVFFNRVCFENGINVGLYRFGNEFDTSYHGLVVAGHSRDLTLYKCRSVAAFPLMILPAQCHDLRMVGNQFEVSPRQSGDCVYASGLYGGVITENSFLYGRRSLISQQGMFDCFVFQNRSEGVANCTNANEEYMSEYGQSAWFGKPMAVSEDAVRVDFPLSEKRMLQRGYVGQNIGEHRWFLMVMSGRGLGQYRVVKDVVGDTITLTEPWTVLPDTDSCLNLITASQHNLWVCNYAGLGSGPSQFVYGSGIENLVVAHSMLLTMGISMYAMMQHEENGLPDLGVVAFNRFVNCDARYSGMGLCLWTNESWSYLDDQTVPIANQIGNIVRHSSFVGGSDSDYVKNQTTWTPVEVASGIQTVGQYCLIERNLMAGFDAGVHVRHASYGTVLRQNRYRHNGCDILDDAGNSLICEPDRPVVVQGHIRHTK